MATANYLTNRKRYGRPQAVLWSNNAGTLDNGLYVPTGYEMNAVVPEGTDSSLIDQFLILSDHNRKEISFNTQRIEQRQRTINGRMRSYHIADKKTISFGWDMLPSRSYNLNPKFDADGNKYDYTQDLLTQYEYTADGGAGGVDILDWYNSHPGPFWMYLAYDKYTNFTKTSGSAEYGHMGQYNEIIQVYFSDFNYTVVKRGQTTSDLWNISVTLEEV